MFWIPRWSDLRSDPLLMGWNLGGLACILIPLLAMTISRLAFVGDGEGNNGGENNNNNNNGNNNNNRRWYQRWGNNYNEDGNQGSGDGTPWWWFSARSADPEEQGKGPLIFVYIYTLLLFVSLTLFGNFMIRQNGDMQTFRGTLFMFTNLAFLVMILVAGLGAIEAEGRELEENGWYGQLSVCIFLTCLFWWIHGMIYSWWLRKRTHKVESSSNTAFDPANLFGTGNKAEEGGSYFSSP